MADINSEFLYHEPCPTCGSSDACSVYSDGHRYCFSCHSFFANDSSEPFHPQTLNDTAIKGNPVALRKRGLSEDTCRKFKIHKDDDVLRFHYYSNSGLLSGTKVKTLDKDFYWEGKHDGSLFGRHLFPATGKRVVITEGEIDAASVYQTQPGWPAVSLPSGAASAKKAIQENLEWLQGYQEIVLFFDNDEAGKKATEDAAMVLPPGRVRIARLPERYKDASDALQQGHAGEITSAILDADTYRPGGIIEGKTLIKLVTEPEPPALHEYPFKNLQKLSHGIRPRELITITAGTGGGKSTFCRQLAAGLLDSGARVGYVALEESNRRSALGLMSTHLGKALHLGEHDHAELLQAYDKTLKDWQVYFFDGFGSFDPDVIYNRIEYLALGLDTNIVFLDHLSILLSGLDGDERRTIDITMTRLRSLVERTGITLFLVCHVSGDDFGKAYEEGGRIQLNKLRGSRSIGQLSDLVIALERNQQDNDHNNTTVRVLKNRYSGDLGVAGELVYDPFTCRFSEEESDF